MKIAILSAAVLAAALHPASATDEPYLQKRAAMVRDQIEREGVSDPRVLAAMRDVPRHLFVSPSFREKAYEPYPLPIGEGQTISQPYVVGFMTQILRLKETDRVLEVEPGPATRRRSPRSSQRRSTPWRSSNPWPSAADGRSRTSGSATSSSGRGRLLRLGGEGAVRRHHRDLRGGHVPPPLLRQLRNGGRMIMPSAVPS